MRRILFAVFLVVACATGTAAESYENAVAALGRRDFTLAVRLFRPLAEQGDLQIYAHEKKGVPQDFVRAHMWYTVAAVALSGDDGKTAMKNRDGVASQMTAAQIEKAQEMARHCQQSQFNECD